VKYSANFDPSSVGSRLIIVQSGFKPDQKAECIGAQRPEIRRSSCELNCHSPNCVVIDEIAQPANRFDSSVGECTMTTATFSKSAKRANARPGSKIRFRATLHRPALTAKPVSWTFLTLPRQASAKLASRSMASVEGTFNGVAFRATLEPDGKGGHWLKVDRKLREASDAQVGEPVTVVLTPLSPDQEPEPKMPADFRKALASDFPGAAKARQVWADITPIARRDWIHWIVSAKQIETRARRIKTACDMLAKGKRRPCCFDRSGMYGKSMSCPLAAPAPE
jgi:hypothetical protein